MPERLRALRDTGELPTPGDEEIAEGVAKFAALDHKVLYSELDLAARDSLGVHQSVQRRGSGAVVYDFRGGADPRRSDPERLVRHEVEHVTRGWKRWRATLGSTGFYGRRCNRRRARSRIATPISRCSQRRSEQISRWRWTKALRNAGVHLRGTGAGSGCRRGSSLATYPTREKHGKPPGATIPSAPPAWSTASTTGYRRPRRDAQRAIASALLDVRDLLDQTKERKQDAFRRRANFGASCSRAKLEAQETADHGRPRRSSRTTGPSRRRRPLATRIRWSI